MTESIGVASRYLALQALGHWRKNAGHFVSEFIDRAVAADQDKSLARELSLGVVRLQRLYRALIIKCLDKPKADPVLLDILSIAAHQIYSLDGIPDHAIGQTTVELADRVKRPAWKGVINAVVRRLLEMRSTAELKPRIAAAFMPQKPADKYSFEPAFIKDLQKDFPKQWEQIATALNSLVPLCTRWRTSDAAADKTNIDPARIAKSSDQWLWWHQVQDALQGPVAAGAAVVQDRSQGYVQEYANIRTGDLVLDYCAAPGGKTLAALDAGASVYSADIQSEKVKQLAPSNPGFSFVQDGLRPACAAVFDCVVVDAPCSNSGVFARRPEARWRYTTKAINELVALQSQLLLAASALVKPGGRLVYATCSINSRENMGVCQTLTNWKVDAVHLAKPDAWQAGGFVARLLRK